VPIRGSIKPPQSRQIPGSSASQAGALFEDIETVDFYVKNLRNPKFCIDTLRRSGNCIHSSQIQIVSYLTHHNGIGNIENRYPQLTGYVFFGLFESHALGHLHASDKISCGSHPADARGNAVCHGHAKGIAYAYLQPVQT
jgi:hypothetical protein